MGGLSGAGRCGAARWSESAAPAAYNCVSTERPALGAEEGRPSPLVSWAGRQVQWTRRSAAQGWRGVGAGACAATWHSTALHPLRAPGPRSVVFPASIYRVSAVHLLLCWGENRQVRRHPCPRALVS